jgi:hypothetical protein
MGGDDVSVITTDFGGVPAAGETIARALDERRSLVLARSRYNREAVENGVILTSPTWSPCWCPRRTAIRPASICDAWIGLAVVECPHRTSVW